MQPFLTTMRESYVCFLFRRISEMMAINVLRLMVSKRLLPICVTLVACMLFCTSCNDDEPEPSSKINSNGYAYVDLGLSVKWAACNVGASTPEDPGDLFSWGESIPKELYKRDNYKFYDNEYKLTKYCTSNSKGVNDGLKTLLPEDDAAHLNMGGDWRMPTISELRELMKCPKEEIYDGDSFCWKITGPNGNSILIPGRSSAGYEYPYDGLRTETPTSGALWSSSLCVSYEQAQTHGCGMPFYTAISYGKPSVIIGATTMSRHVGAAVRGVIK